MNKPLGDSPYRGAEGSWNWLVLPLIILCAFLLTATAIIYSNGGDAVGQWLGLGLLSFVSALILAGAGK